MAKPNILWICTDQQRWDTLDSLGFPGSRTPHIDGLAAAGTVFQRAYAQSPACTPSRATFLSGLYPIAHQLFRNGNAGVPEKMRLVPTYFREAGYRTGLIGKLHLTHTQFQPEQRIDDGYQDFYWSQHPYPDWGDAHDYRNWLVDKGVDPEALYSSIDSVCAPGIPANLHQNRWAGDRAEAFITTHSDEPWLLSVNIDDPHPPFCPPPDYFDLFRPEKMPPPIFGPNDLAHQTRLAAVDIQASVAVDPHTGASTRLKVGAGAGGALHDTAPEAYDARALRAAYQGMIVHIDDMVGRLLTALEATGQRERTIVVFMSDHGELLGDHGLIYKGCRFYEGLVHVPLIIAWPDELPALGSSDALVELIDVPSTLFDLAGLPVPAYFQGLSTKALLKGDAPRDTHKPFVMSEYFDALNVTGNRASRGTMYFDGRYKLNLYHDVGLGELFDHCDDSDEVNDLFDAPDHRELVADLTKRSFAAMMRASAHGPERVADY